MKRQASGKKDEEITMLLCLLKVCAKKKDVNKGRSLHEDILKRGLLSKSPYLASALISMYAKCGLLSKAAQVLEELPIRNLACWNALIGGYVQQGQGYEALNCFEQMRCSGFRPDASTFVCILKSCAKTGDIEQGREVHDNIIKRGLEREVLISNTLIDVYAKWCEPLR